MPEDIWAKPGDTLLRNQRCEWCLAPGIYNDGTQCKHGPPPRGCPMHGKWTDLNLVTRGRRAVVKCSHYGKAGVVLWADPIADDKEHGTYTVQFYMVGVGSELYMIPPKMLMCPHAAYDRLVADMLAGARPSQNRVPPAESRTVEPGKSIDESE